MATDTENKQAQQPEQHSKVFADFIRRVQGEDKTFIRVAEVNDSAFKVELQGDGKKLLMQLAAISESLVQQGLPVCKVRAAVDAGLRKTTDAPPLEDLLSLLIKLQGE